MGFFGGSSRLEAKLNENHRWSYINLDDFKTSNCITLFSYIWLWLMILVTNAVYVADTFTAVKLLGFNEWSSSVEPKIPFAVSKWIFAICILVSWALLIFEWQRAIRVIRRGNVAEDYLDPLAVKLQSMRIGTGWRRFLVFAKLTKSKKKMTWVALFVYFERMGAVRLLAADGPRQVVNAITLWAICQAKIIPEGANAAPKGQSPVAQFFINIKLLGEQNKMQTVILSTMAFTLFIWVLCMLFLITALILYITVLWHQIKNETLSQFCRRKIETRLERIVKAKMEKIWAKQQAKQAKMEAKAVKKGTAVPGIAPVSRKPTLPMLGDALPPKTAEFSIHAGESTSTLPVYDSRPGTPLSMPLMQRQPTLPSLDGNGRPLPPTRSATHASNYSDSSVMSNAPLLQAAARPGTAQSFRQPPLSRSVTGSTDRGFGGPSPVAMPMPPPMRSNSSFSQSSSRPMSPYSAGPTPSSINGVQNYSPLSGQGGPSYNGPVGSTYDRRSPSPSGSQSYEMAPVNSTTAAYPGQRSYTPQSAGPTPYASGGRSTEGFGPFSGGASTAPAVADYFTDRSRTPQPRPIPRRDLTGPQSSAYNTDVANRPGNSLTPPIMNGNRSIPPPLSRFDMPQRSATAPMPDLEAARGLRDRYGYGPRPGY